MLVSLHVKNLALIQEAEVFFGPGLNILTGETGAGKSIILGSVNLALGAKADRDMIRNGADYALIELVFQLDEKAQQKKITDCGFELEDNQIILQRRIMPQRSICKVNGETVSARVQRELAGMLLDIHGQHDSQILLQPKKYIEILDGFAGEKTARLKAEIRESFHRCTKLGQELSANQLDDKSRARELSMIQFELEEIEKAKLAEGEDEQLEKEYRKMVNARKIMETVSHVYQLTGYESDGGAGENTGRAWKELSVISGLDEELAQLSEQLSDIESLLNDFNRSISDYMDGLEFEESEFFKTEERLNQINRLKDKYGSTIAEILAYAEERRTEAGRLENQDAYTAQLKKQLASEEEKLEKLCEEATKERKSAAAVFSCCLQRALQDLNFLHVDFSVDIRKKDSIGTDGQDEVDFLISTNPGEPKKSLALVASGGELSRMMLALKTIAAREEEIGTFIFDEIDAGISGRTAWKVSEKLAMLGRDHQIICITHLPQIAAMADNHFLIEKNAESASTTTTIRELKEREILEELARLLGAEKLSETAIANARELKDLAAKTKQY